MSGKNFLSFSDDVSFSLVDKNLVKIWDDYSGMFSAPATNNQKTMGLQVTIAATHSGIVTRNNGFYVPDKMRKGASSFTDNYAKPILLHHEDHKDNIGRVIASRYVDTAGVVQDRFNLKNGLLVKDKKGQEKGTITDTLLQDFILGKMPFGMQVDVICSLFRDSLLEDNSYDGLGYIEIVANIVDKEAIEKFLDGRYLTGSVGATTDKAVCSVCRQDWTDTGPCDHRPGGIYDGTKCFLITGNLFYDEYSFVNVPADRHSKVLTLNYNGIQNSIEVAKDYTGRIYEARINFPQYDSAQKAKEESVMSEPIKPTEGTLAVQDEVVTPSAVVEPVVAPVVVADATIPATPTPEQLAEIEEKNFQDFLTKALSGVVLSLEEQERLYDLMWKEAEVAVTEGVLDSTKIVDAKLSTEKRKSLAKSTFCGPNKSFPVPDCAHVTAARRLLGKYKGEGNKDSILACVTRKAKALGCDTKKSDAVIPVTEPEKVVTPEKTVDAMQHARILRILLAAIEEDKFFSGDEPVLSEDENKLLQNILKRMAGLVGQDNVKKALYAQDLAMAPECEQALLDEVVRVEDVVGQIRDEMEKMKTEYSQMLKDSEGLQDAVIKATEAARKAKEAQFSTLKALQDNKPFIDDLKTITDEVLSADLVKLIAEVDMVKITDKLGNGMSREPTGTVGDPTAIRDDKTDDQKRQMPTVDSVTIEDTYFKILRRQGSKAAEAFIKRLQTEGLLSADNKNK